VSGSTTIRHTVRKPNRNVSTGTISGDCCLRLTFPAGDVNRTGTVTTADVQLVVNKALGLEVGWNCDIDGNGAINAVDVQLAFNAPLGL